MVVMGEGAGLIRRFSTLAASTNNAHGLRLILTMPTFHGVIVMPNELNHPAPTLSTAKAERKLASLEVLQPSTGYIPYPGVIEVSPWHHGARKNVAGAAGY
jgi:hypothetical protein